MSSKILKIIKIFMVILFGVGNIFASNLNLKSTSSAIKIDAGANLNIENATSTSKGKIIRETNGTIEGSSITFEEGKLEEEGGKVNISGTLTPGIENKIFLNGNQKFEGKLGQILQAIKIRGKGNLLSGNLILSDDVDLLDENSSLSVDLYSKLTSNLKLNGGSLVLLHDLDFTDFKRVVGPGKISLNGNRLSFGAKELNWSEDVSFQNAAEVQICANTNLNSIWSFAGSNNILEGNRSIFCLGGSGKIIVERGSSLLIKNMILRDIWEHGIFCMDDSATITFQNVKFYQSQDYTFSIGHFEVVDKFDIYGGYKFTYKSFRQSKILSHSNLYLDKNVTFSYDPPIANKELILFQDASSSLYLGGATLHSTLTGMHFKKGTMLIDRFSHLSCEKTENTDIGIIFGNDRSEDDFICQFLGNSILELIAGSLKYRNVNRSSWCMENMLSYLRISSGCNLYLYQNLNLDLGHILFQGSNWIYYIPGKKIIGSTNVLGYVGYQELLD